MRVYVDRDSERESEPESEHGSETVDAREMVGERGSASARGRERERELSRARAHERASETRNIETEGERERKRERQRKQKIERQTWRNSKRAIEKHRELKHKTAFHFLHDTERHTLSIFGFWIHPGGSWNHLRTCGKQC